MQGLATAKEVAAYLNVHVKSVDRWASTGVGPPFIRVEGARRYRWADVEAYLAERTVATNG